MEGIFEAASKFSRINPDNPNLTEKEKIAVELYNSALNAFSLKNEDIAIIELKKSVTLNPELYEAKTLLGICYYHMGAYEKSALMFKDVGAAEKNGMLAYRIKSGLNSVDEPLKRKKKITKKTVRNDPDSETVRIKTKQEKKDIVVKYIIGITIGLLIGLLSGLPGYISSEGQVDIDELEARYQQKIAVLESDIAEAGEDIKELELAFGSLEEQYIDAKKDDDYLESVINLYKAENLYRAGEKEQAKEVINSLKVTDFESPYLEKYNFLIDELM